MTQGLRDLAMQAAAIAQDAGEHALTDQVTPKDLSSLYSVTRDYSRGLTVDTQFGSVMEYFEIFLQRMLLCRKAAEKLGLQFKLVINGQQLL